MRALGIDLGERRIGLAISDADGNLAGPLKVINHTGGEIEEILRIIGSEGVEIVVVGLPLNMDGSLGEQGEKAQAYARQLQERARMPVELWDERLSTFEAERKLRESGKKGPKLKKALDKWAAAVILQDFLDHKKQN